MKAWKEILAIFCANLCSFKKTSDLNDLLGTHINYVQAFLAHMRKQSTMGWDYFWGGIDSLINHWKTTKKMFDILMMMFSLKPSFWAKNKNTMLLKKDLHTITMHSQLLRPAHSELEYYSQKLVEQLVKTIGNLLWLDMNCKSIWKERPTNTLKGRILKNHQAFCGLLWKLELNTAWESIRS